MLLFNVKFGDAMTTQTKTLPATFEMTLRGLCRPVSKSAYPGDLQPLRELLARLGQPQTRFEAVIVAGSVGKGTTAHLVAAALTQAGMRGGLFTGPHLHSYRERLALGGQAISPEALAERAARVLVLENNPLSTFEVATALAFDWFAAEAVRMAVLEVGIGGRYDAVNEAPAGSAIIMPVEREHTFMLGKSLAEIAFHKAGVVPRDGFAVVAPQMPEALEIIEATCRERNAEMVYLPARATWQNESPGGAFRVKYGEIEVAGPTNLPGYHNGLNIAAAVVWAAEAARRGLAVGPQHAGRAAEVLRMPGRMERVERGGVTVLIDGAHTPGGAGALSQVVGGLYNGGPLTYVVGVSYDKQPRPLIEALEVPPQAKVIFTDFYSHRASGPERLAAVAGGLGIEATLTPDVATALEQVLAAHAGRGLVVVAGSLYLAAEAREALGLLDPGELAEAKLTREVFSGDDYLAKVAP